MSLLGVGYVYIVTYTNPVLPPVYSPINGVGGGRHSPLSYASACNVPTFTFLICLMFSLEA